MELLSFRFLHSPVTQYDENDPNDRRRSQYLMKAKLDEIEKVRRLRNN